MHLKALLSDLLLHTRRYSTFTTAKMAVAGLQVVGGTPAISPSLLYTDSSNKGFLINAGEGIQRMILESPGLRIANITDVLTTRFSWNTCASIPGIALFRRDQLVLNSTNNPLTVWGTDHVNGFMRTTQLDCFADEVGVDRHLVLKSVKDLENFGKIGVKAIQLVSSYSYVFHLPPKAESVSKAKLKELKIPPKLMSTLMKTGSVKLPDGRTIEKAEVLEPIEPSPVFIVVDARSESECEKLLETDFHEHIDKDKDTLMVMVHFTDKAYLNTESYKTFMAKYDIDHLIMCHNPSSRILHDCSQRNAIMSSILPLEKLFAPSSEDTQELPELLKDVCVSTTISEHLLKYNMYAGRKTPIGWSKSNIVGKSFDFQVQVDNAKKVYDNFITGQKYTNSAKKIKLSFKCPEITFLGTTSTYSSTYRNVSGILLQTDGFNALLDCGEMTVGQMVRLYGLEKAHEYISKLSFLYISHIHFDHCGGSMLAAEIYYKINNKPLKILCPIRTLPWFKYLSSVFKVPLDLVPLGKLVVEKEMQQQLLADTGVKVDLCVAKHTRDSWCVAITTENWKVAYSGDTMPNKPFVNIGKDCDILIHEATHQSSLAEDAAKKKHSTVAQAIEIGQEMNAKYTILTHFSLRYQKLPPIIDEKVPENVAFAHDFMRVTEGNVEEWCRSTKLLPLLFPDHYQDLLKQSFYKP